MTMFITDDTACIFKMHFDIILVHPGLLSDELFRSGLNAVVFLIYPIRATYPIHAIFHDIFTPNCLHVTCP
jgi:hypothetical protein